MLGIRKKTLICYPPVEITFVGLVHPKWRLLSETLGIDDLNLQIDRNTDSIGDLSNNKNN